MKETIIIIDKNELFDRLVENDTISNTIHDTINLLADNERIVFDKAQAQIKRNLAGLGYEC